MEKTSLIKIVFNLLLGVLSQTWVYLLVVGGVWLLLRPRASSRVSDTTYWVLAILLIGIGLGMIGTRLAALSR